MKKNFLCILLLSVIMFLVSCDGLFMTESDISHIVTKTSMEPFAELNDPIVITMPVYQQSVTFGSKRMKEAGDIFVVYDWENEVVHDWAFFAGNHGLSNWRAVEMGSPTKYYDAGESSGLIGCLDAETGKVTVTKNAVNGTFANLNNNNELKSRYGMIETFGYANGSETCSVNFFDSETGRVSARGITIPIYTSGNVFTPHADKNGNYWMSYQYKDFNYIAKFDGGTGKVEKFKTFPMKKNSTYEVMSVLCVYDDFIVVNDDIAPWYPNIVIYKTDNMTEPYAEIPLPYNDPEGMFLFRMVEIRGELYAVFGRWGNNEIWKLDVEKGELCKIAKFSFDYTETVYVRGSRIYFINSRNLQRFACMYYDTATEEIGKVKSFTFEEVTGY